MLSANNSPAPKQHYDQWHQVMSDGESVSNDSSRLYPWHKTVLKLLPDLNGSDVLEIGCGRGDFALEIFRRFPLARVTGIDFSTVAIDIARKKSLERTVPVSFAIGDAQCLPFAAESFNWIISCECLEHVPFPEAMAKEIWRTLRPGAGFILTTENYFNGMLIAWLHCLLTRRPFNSGAGVQAIEHFFLFWGVRRILARAGLSIRHMESNHFQWLLLPRVNPAQLCTEDVESPTLKRLLLPFGRHFTYFGEKPP